MNKRKLTDEESQKAIIYQADMWNSSNPKQKISLEEWKEKEKEAVGEGFIDECCDCGKILLAFQHFVRCSEDKCPFKDGGPSMLEQLLGDSL